MPENTASVATQTSGTPLDNLREYAERSFLAVIDMREVRDQFWSHILSCIKMPRGGVNGGGSMHCETEFIAGSEAIVKFLMEDLPLMPNKRYNQSPPPPHWEESPSISTYSALTNHMIDSYFRLHRRNAARGYRGYRVVTAGQHSPQRQTLTQLQCASSPCHHLSLWSSATDGTGSSCLP